MITCSVCGQGNDESNTLCSSCKSFIQGRVDALNLFETIWGLIESPRYVFRRIVLAKHKNYALLLSSIAGIALIFDLAWYKHAGDLLHSLPALIGIAIIVGPALGMLSVLALTYTMQILTKSLGGMAKPRNLFATLAYGTVPLSLSLVFFLPIELAVFGSVFFGTNPPPMAIRPFEYTVLVGLKSLAGLWTIFLLIHATMAANSFPMKKFLPVGLMFIGLALGMAIGLHYVNI